MSKKETFDFGNISKVQIEEAVKGLNRLLEVLNNIDSYYVTKVEPELKNCPFCGSYDITLYSRAADTYNIACEECGSGTHHCATKEMALAIWNDRVDSSEF